MPKLSISLIAGLWLFAAGVEAGTVRAIRLMTTDDLGLSAAYYPVETNAAPAVILLHSFGKDRDEWAPIIPLLQSNGIATLALDLRGHGESTRRLTANGPELVDYRKLSPSDQKALLLDINQAYDWLADQPGIDKRHIAVVGSSYGANLALRYSVFNEDIAALVLLSPGMVYESVRTEDVIVRYGKRPLRIAVSHDDSMSMESCKQLMELRQRRGQVREDGELVVCSGDLHGVPMLLGVKGLNEKLFGWLQKVLQDGSPPPP